MGVSDIMRVVTMFHFLYDGFEPTKGRLTVCILYHMFLCLILI